MQDERRAKRRSIAQPPTTTRTELAKHDRMVVLTHACLGATNASVTLATAFTARLPPSRARRHRARHGAPARPALALRRVASADTM